MIDLIGGVSAVPFFRSEILVADYAQTMMALSSLALGCAVVASLFLAVASAVQVEISSKHRWLIIGIWGISTGAAGLTAGSIASWGVPVAAVISLPALLLLAVAVRRRLEGIKTAIRPAGETDEQARTRAA